MLLFNLKSIRLNFALVKMCSPVEDISIDDFNIETQLISNPFFGVLMSENIDLRDFNMDSDQIIDCCDDTPYTEILNVNS